MHWCEWKNSYKNFIEIYKWSMTVSTDYMRSYGAVCFWLKKYPFIIFYK